MDVARKLVILARELGLMIEVNNIEIENLVNEAHRDLSIESYLKEIVNDDAAIEDKLNQAIKDNKVLTLENIQFQKKTILLKKGEIDSRQRQIFLNEKGKKLFEEIFMEQKKRIYNALKNSDPDSVIKFKNVLSKIINE